ncbi:MAG: adenosine kinase [Caulobacteraceae bacterium]|nr:adenosine kinase [Caulobacteraceae bacterium]
MNGLYDVAAIGNAIVDVIAPAGEEFLVAEGLAKGAMTLIDEQRAADLYDRMAPGIEASGGSAGNTVAGVASLGGRSAYIGKVADDAMGGIFTHDIRAIGAHFTTPPLASGPATARCLINVTPDGQRTMSTYLGACVELTAADVEPEIIESAKIVYLEGYLFDPEEARRAFAKAAGLARGAGRKIALSLSDAFVVERHRHALLAFIDTQVDILFANESEMAALFETANWAAAAREIRGRVDIAAITRSEAGSLVLTPETEHIINAAPGAKVVDTTGAGDQYAAGFLYGLANGRPLDVCGKLGSLAAAEVIGHYGPRPETSLAELARAGGLEAA